MKNSLICFDDKYISTAQAIMADDCVLEGFIQNLSKGPIIKIHGSLQDARFLHVSRMLRGYKLDPTLINTLVERWRRETHTFHLSCGECTITLKDVAWQLDLPVDGLIVAGSVVIPGKEDLCVTFLGKVSNKFQGGQIEMKWLETNFKKLPSSVTDVVKE
ncbi:hypothetical protein J1N35_038417 [Gossypium stocksii]|uniref:Aminotransferase-like plant mobile domain-containing protein n=1 Tax=Gossypium stocksii TaxID=47602 RepID=A0A9D3UM46_9ROSI|nr:hypothetical protein J1N35_038417 [Gossypium stocksii]